METLFSTQVRGVSKQQHPRGSSLDGVRPVTVQDIPRGRHHRLQQSRQEVTDAYIHLYSE